MKSILAPMMAAAVATAAGGASAPALAQAFPTKTITIVVPTAAGGGNDAMARTIAQKLGPLLGQRRRRRASSAARSRTSPRSGPGRPPCGRAASRP